jgi:ketol-acid reductoisomerase
MSNTFTSTIFKNRLKNITVSGTKETVMHGKRGDYSGLKKALAGVKQIAIIGWSSQGPAQAQNIRDTLKKAGVNTKVVVGLRKSSQSRKGAQEAGFSVKDGTLLNVEEALSTSEMSLFLISDAAMAHHGQELISLMPAGSTVGLSHGFFIGHLSTTGQKIRPDVDVIGVCPKGMGPSVRKLYLQGSGINNSFAVYQGGQKALDRALAWSLCLGAPYTFKTTLDNEWRSDIFGERAMLLGGVHGLVEALYANKRQNGTSAEQAYIDVVESLVGPLSSTISKEGLIGVVDKLKGSDNKKFVNAYNTTYPVLLDLTKKIYIDVSSGREIAEVVSDSDNNIPMLKVDGTEMWRVGENVRDKGIKNKNLTIDPMVAGVYIAGMMAQVTVLRSHGHAWSEVVNESIIEAVDSLNPFMKARGVAYMVDNCSITARRGSRKWAPHYQAWLSQAVLPVLDGILDGYSEQNYYDNFVKHDVHKALKLLGAMRPPIDISVS